MQLINNGAGAGRVPSHALLLSLVALWIPVLSTSMFPNWTNDELGILIWLLALIPAFLLSYYRGWRGATLALAAVMAVFSVVQVVLLLTGFAIPSPAVILAAVVILLAVCLGSGWLAERLRRSLRRAEELALTDVGTSLPNRRHAMLHLQRAFAAAERGGSLCVVVFDIDHFKRINDRFGHDTGDAVLRAFGAVLAAHTRGMNLSGRFGGEEFVCVLEGGGARGAEEFANRVRVRFAAEMEQQPWGRVTTSAGVAQFETGMASPEVLIAAADQALYRAKKGGRDRTVVLDSSPAGGAPALRIKSTNASAAAAGRGERILVVDDDPAVLGVLLKMLRQRGYTPLGASDPQQALALVLGLAEPLDLMIVDVIMPGMSGFRLVEMVAEQQPATRVLYISGYDREDVDWSGVPGAMKAFLPKPIAVQRLIESVRTMLDAEVPPQEALAVPVPNAAGTLTGERQRHAILLIADSAEDHALVRDALRGGVAGTFTIEWVQRLDEALPRVQAQQFHAIVLALNGSESDGLTSIRTLKHHAGAAPIIVLTAADDEAVALQTVIAGAQDYLVKGQISGTMLARAVRQAIERKRVLRALRDSEARHRMLFDTMAHGVIYYDDTGAISDANAAAQQMLGLTLPQLHGRTLEDARWRALHADGRDLTADSHPVALALRTGTTPDAIVMGVFNPVEQAHRWILVDAHAEFNASETRPCRVCSTLSDITRLKAAEEAAHLQKRVLDTAYGQLPVMMVIYDANCRIVWVNDCWTQTLGWTHEDATSDDFLSRIYPHPAERVRALAYVSSRTAVWGDIRPLTRDGRVIDTCWVNVVLPDGTSLGIGRDITEQVKAETAARAASEQLSAILDTSPVPIIAVDRDINVILWNRAAESVFGWSADEVIGRPYPVQGPRGNEEVKFIFDAALRGDELHSHAVQRFARDGRLVELNMWNAPLRDAHGDVVALVGIFVDTTAHRELEQQLLHAQKMEAVGRMAGGIAHDFNNILTAMAGHADLALETTIAADAVHPELVEIRKGVQRASVLTRQLLAFSRRQVAQPRVLSVRDSLADMESMLRRLIGENIQFSVEPDGAGNVVADAGQLEQIVVNLVVNAQDALGASGRIAIGSDNISLVPPFTGRFAYPPVAGEYVVISVSDDGHGIPDAIVDRMFDPFFTTKEQGKGTGLGLSIVYGLVKQAGGCIAVDSVPGAGTTFRIYLPRVDTPVHKPHSAAVTGRRVARSETILLAEDEAAVRAIAARVLRRDGYHVLVAEDGVDALSQAHAHDGTIDLVITDLVMPRMSGRELAERVRAAQPHAKVLLMSGYSNENLTDMYESLGDVTLLEKPFSVDDLSRTVRTVLDDVGSAPASRLRLMLRKDVITL